MHRRPTLIALMASVVAIVAACGGGTPSASLMTSPTEIVLSALTATEDAKTVHVDVAVDGSAPVSIPGLPSTGAPIELTDTSASADLDLAAPAAHATFSVPALFNLAGEIIAVDGQGYLKTTLTGAQFERVALSTLPVDLTDTGALIDGLGDFLLSDQIQLVKGDDVTCGTEQCYTVTASLTPEQMAAMTGGAAAGLPIDLSNASIDVTVRVEQDAPNQLAGLTIALTTAPDETLTADLVFSKWGEPVSIEAPSADQVQGG